MLLEGKSDHHIKDCALLHIPVTCNLGGDPGKHAQDYPSLGTQSEMMATMLTGLVQNNTLSWRMDCK